MIEFFRDEKGFLSLTRLNSLLLVIAGIVYVFVNKDIVASATLIGLGISGKVVQKGIEVNHKK